MELTNSETVYKVVFCIDLDWLIMVSFIHLDMSFVFRRSYKKMD